MLSVQNYDYNNPGNSLPWKPGNNIFHFTAREPCIQPALRTIKWMAALGWQPLEARLPA